MGFIFTYVNMFTYLSELLVSKPTSMLWSNFNAFLAFSKSSLVFFGFKDVDPPEDLCDADCFSAVPGEGPGRFNAEEEEEALALGGVVVAFEVPGLWWQVDACWVSTMAAAAVEGLLVSSSFSTDLVPLAGVSSFFLWTDLSLVCDSFLGAAFFFRVNGIIVL